MLLTSYLLLMLCVTFFCWYTQFYIKRRTLYKLAEKFNGPPAFPIIGNLSKCLLPLSEMVDTILQSTTYYKSPQRFWFGPNLIVHIFDPEDLQIVLNSPYALQKQPHLYRLLELITGRSVATAPVEEWKRRRRLMAPIFNQKVLDGFFDTFVDHSKRLLRDLDEKVGKGTVDIHNELNKFGLDNVMYTLLDFNRYSEKDIHRISAWIKSLGTAVALRTTNILYFFDFAFNLSSYGKQFNKTKKVYDAFIKSIIEKWQMASLEKLDNSKDDSETLGPQKTKKLIEYLVAASNGSGKFTVEELQGEINSLIFAGLETIPSIVGYLLILLGIHQDIQNKVYQELKQVMGTNNEIHLDDLKQLHYLEQVIKEGFRLFPPVLGVGRYTTQDIQLTKHILPAKTTVMVGLLALHRNPEIWQNPLKFDPDRFLPQEVEKHHPYSWIPFSAGPRNCLGIRFAMLSLKIVMAFLITQFRIETDYKSVEEIHLTILHKLLPTNGFRISATRR